MINVVSQQTHLTSMTNSESTLYVTELDENPYASDEEWEMWLYENIFETNDWEVTAEMIV